MKRFVLGLTVGISLLLSITVVRPVMADDDDKKVPVTALDSTEVFGVSKLKRDADGISFKLKTTGLEPNTATTLWLYIDESPDEGPDIPPGAGDEPYEIRLNVAGGFSDKHGKIKLSGHFPAGDLPEADGKSVLNTHDGSFDDPLGATILFYVRSHGPRIEGREDEQTSEIFGGCPPNTCATVQKALHNPADDEVAAAPSVRPVGKIALTWGKLKTGVK